jgi:hypothetical protein
MRPPPSMPAEAKNIVNDTRELREDVFTTDDANEYPKEPASTTEALRSPRTREATRTNM